MKTTLNFHQTLIALNISKLHPDNPFSYEMARRYREIEQSKKSKE